MCISENKSAHEEGGSGGGGSNPLTGILGCLAVSFMASTIALAVVFAQEKDKNAALQSTQGASMSAQGGSDGSTSPESPDSPPSNLLANGYGVEVKRPPAGENPCAGKKLNFDNIDCMQDGVVAATEQAGANVTVGYKGLIQTGLNGTTREPITAPYYKAGLCPVNVHWHLGTEHLSVGEYDDLGTGPKHDRRRAAGKARQGYQCRHYDEADPKFTAAYDWKHCVDMEVGQTYEIHWPHSSVGACGTINQFQTPFYDGVFCNLDMDSFLSIAGNPQNIASNVGVQSQTFVIVNDEDYYYPDLMHGMIVDAPKKIGTEITKYTGSTTGTSRDNEVCSQYSPITWQVDRKCHMVSASTFDKMCADMKAQRDDMSDDLYAHGSRELVADFIAADNHQNRNLRKQQE